MITGFSGCQKKVQNGAAAMHWDRDMCERCKMAISERKFAAQIINPQTHQVYKFDDLGCAVLWMDEEHIPWKEKAVIWITDAKNGKWIDARKALYVDGAITPMAYGFAAYTKETVPKNAKAYDYRSVVKMIEAREKLNSKKVKAY
jgi:nitrous oxide reductase accessory protein NosL